MDVSLLQTILALLAGIVLIVFLTVKIGLHPFFALLLACFVTGLLVKLSVPEILQLVKTGFGEILSKLTLIIVLGTAMGVLLEKNGHTTAMATAIVKWVGIKRSPMALSITGYIVGLPIFCDSGYIVLNGINQSLIRKTGFSVAQMSISLGAGLYAVHCLIPPHPGATAAAGTLDADFGRLIAWGMLVAIPGMLAGHYWALYAGKKGKIDKKEKEPSDPEPVNSISGNMSASRAFIPVLVPIILMALRSLLLTDKNKGQLVFAVLDVLGEPAIALAIGLFVVIGTGKSRYREWMPQLGTAVEKAGSILVIIAAGSAFGSVLAATQIGKHFGNTPELSSLGIFFPFLLTAILKTAQGSSTVAIITAASLVMPLLPVLELTSANGKILAVLSMGAGSMMISHTNDAYFWVISKFSDIDIRTMLRVHSVASIWMGLVCMLMIYLLSLIVL